MPLITDHEIAHPVSTYRAIGAVLAYAAAMREQRALDVAELKITTHRVRVMHQQPTAYANNMRDKALFRRAKRLSERMTLYDERIARLQTIYERFSEHADRALLTEVIHHTFNPEDEREEDIAWWLIGRLPEDPTWVQDTPHVDFDGHLID